MDNPKVIKKGDQVITSYVDEKTGKIAVYEVGIKLEVSDYSGQWFPAKIVEVDKGEKEVLVHFENWSARFDEWIKMDSNRLRASPNTNIIKTQFKVGEQVEALWNTDGQRYPGIIQNVLPNDYYQVLFDDGIKLKKKYNQIFKLKPVTRNIARTAGSVQSTGSKFSSLASGIQTPPLPELTPISQMVAAVEQSQAQAAKMSLQPPPLHPKPNSIAGGAVADGSGSGTKRQHFPTPSLVSPVPKVVKAKKRSTPAPIPAIPPSQPEVSSESVTMAETPNSTPDASLSSDEPVSSKRKRTVQDYSALLRIRRKFPYHKDSEIGERSPRPSRRSRASPLSEPPQLFPEAALPQVKSDPESLPAKDSTVAEPITDVSDLSLTIANAEKEGESTEVAPLPVAIPPLPPKAKLKRRFKPFSSRRRSVKRQQIKYVVVDDEEFLAAGGAANLNKPKALSSSTVDGKVTEDKPDGESGVTSESVTPNGEQPDGSSADGPRIIKRRRRRTYAHLSAVAADAPSLSPSTATPDEPLTKRKRTIHDYSMLLKTRPKFFFDIDEEQKRPNVLPAKKRRVEETPPLDTSLVSPLLAVENEAGRGVECFPTAVESETKKPQELALPSFDPSKKPETGIETGPTSIATHRPIRRSSSQFARKSYASSDEFELTQYKGGVSVALQSLDGDNKATPTRTPSNSGRKVSSKLRERNQSPEDVGNSPDSRKAQLGSKLNQLDLSGLVDEDEELLDIDYSISSVASSNAAAPPRKSPITSVASTSAASLGSTKAQPHTANKESGKRRNNRWWKKRGAHSVKRASSTENGENVQAKSHPGPRAKKLIPIRKRPGDLLSGLTLKRIKTIRTKLYRQGFKKRIIAEPALKDVSVDIISCVCGSTDEHGLMVQCEYCQCWQHGQCFEFETVEDMPKNYVCEACLYPDNVRSRTPSDLPYDFYKTGKLPRFTFGPGIRPRTTKFVQETNALIERLYQVREIIQTSRVHMNIMEAKPDHPKLYQWDKAHTTIRESNQERKFNRVYRPLLRRLLYFNRDDPNYVEKLRAKVEAVVRKRNHEEKIKADQRLNEKFGIFTSPRKGTTSQKRNAPSTPPSVSKHVVESPATKEKRRLEMESLRIRKELETLNTPKTSVSTEKDLGSSGSSSNNTDDDTEVSAVMESILTKLEDMIPSNEFSTLNCDSLIQKPLDTCSIKTELPPALDELPAEAAAAEVKTTSLTSSSNNTEPVSNLLSTVKTESDVKLIDSSETTSIKTKNATGIDEASLAPTVVSNVDPTPPATQIKLEELSAVDLMAMDPLDPKFNTIAEDLVKSCCEEPESLIKTLEDLAKNSDGGEGVGDLEEDLIGFLDDALMDTTTFDAAGTGGLSNFVAPKTSPIPMGPPPPPAPIFSSASTFLVPPSPPPRLTLTRITPELCRGNLVLTVLDQQHIIDQHLDEIEARVVELERMSGNDVGMRASSARQIANLQAKVRKMVKEFRLMNSIGKKAEHGLRELIRLDPSRLDTASSPSSDVEEEGLENEETDSAEEEEEEDLSEEMDDMVY